MSPAKTNWVTVWTASAQGAYPVGSAVAQPDLSMAIPQPEKGLVNQSFRTPFKPAIAANTFRLRISNVFGTQTLRLKDLSISLHLGGGALVPGSCTEIADMEIDAGTSAWTQGIELKSMHQGAITPATDRTIVFSGWVEGESGPITWHAKAMATSFLSKPNTRVHRDDYSELAFPFSTTSVFFLDAVDADLPNNCQAIVAFGDSLTNGTFTTLNGFDRWTDVLQRMLISMDRTEIAVLNAGIGGNQVLSPLSIHEFWRGGPAAIERLERDVLSLSGIQTVIWLEGINDFSENGNAELEAVRNGMTQAVHRLRAAGVRVIGATLPSAFNSTRQGHGHHVQNEKRKAFNQFILSSGLHDAVVDIDRVLTNSKTGCLDALFDSDNTLGGPGDGLHPNRAGHAAMANEILKAIT
jgi:lysophospholipase L1-like esterase